MTESEVNLIGQIGIVKDGKPTFDQIVKYVMIKKSEAIANSTPYDPKTDETLLEWSKKGKFTLTSFGHSFYKNLVFKDGTCTVTEKIKRNSKFYPKKNRGY